MTAPPPPSTTHVGLAAFTGLVDLASAAVGGAALLCSDDFFAPMERLVDPRPAAFDPDAYTDHGKLMDGWESRRRRTPGHDWCILRLGVPGRIRAVDIDTSFFLGNHGPFASLDATDAPADADAAWLRDHATWTEVLPSTALQRGSHNLAAVAAAGRFTHVRLHMYPDGGIARLRVLGDPMPHLPAGGIDLALLTHGGQPLACSDMFFSPMTNLVLPGRSVYMGGGWETRRSRPPGRDWIIVRLAGHAAVDRVVIDTGHFKGNFPDRAGLDGLCWPDAPPHALIDHPAWRPISPDMRLRADTEHLLPVDDNGPWTHVRLRITPDGGVARLRVIGHLTPAAPDNPLVRWLNAAPDAEAHAALLRCCGSRRWADAVLAGRPYASRVHLHGHAEVAWWRLGDGDWREAFTHHPRIGADPEALKARFASTATWSSTEQAGVVGADPDTLRDLAAANTDYEQAFGHVFLVCATGLRADEMLARLRDRMGNSPANELARVAAGEQVKITRIRLDRLGDELSAGAPA